MADGLTLEEYRLRFIRKWGSRLTEKFSQERLFGLGEMEAEALELLRLIARQTVRGENLDAELLDRAKAIVDRYDYAMMRGHEAPGVVSFRRL